MEEMKERIKRYKKNLNILSEIIEICNEIYIVDDKVLDYINFIIKETDKEFKRTEDIIDKDERVYRLIKNNKNHIPRID